MSRRGVLVLVTVAALAAGAALMTSARPPAPPGTATAAPGAAPPAPPRTARADAAAAARTAAPAAPPSARAASTAGGDAPPPGVDVAQWQRLRTELAARPDGAGELERLRAYFAFADALQRFRSLRAQPGVALGLRELAAALDVGLAERLHQREIHGAEAYQIKRAVLEVLEPEPDLRVQRLQAWQASQAASASDDAARARDREYLRQQQARVAAWAAQPEAQRDGAQLQRELQALRQRVYRAPGS